MKKYFLSISALAVLFAYSLIAEPTKSVQTNPAVQPAQTAPPSNAKIEIEGGDTYNWGKVKPANLPLKATINILNKGTDTLRIGEVKPGCGCTTAPLAKKNIEPGGFAPLPVTVNVNYDGKVTKSITIHSNDPKNESKILMLEADIQSALSKFPSYLSFSPTDLNKEVTATMKLKNTTDTVITIKDVQVEPEGMVVNLKHNQKIPPNSDYDVKVTYTPTKYGGFSCKLTFKTDHPEVAKVEVNGWGQVNQPPTPKTDAAQGTANQSSPTSPANNDKSASQNNGTANQSKTKNK